uniref:Bacteriorhodopsin-like protein n=1 Tax=viral metagenome TaxID=1070528 RepID=A0A6C0ERT5_9ZZZZ
MSDDLKKETFIQDTPKEKVEKIQNPVNYYVKFSFMITYILLLTTATITFIEAMRTPIPEVRHILNLETCISVVAGYFYSVFVQKIEEYSKQDKPIDWADITKTRYIDWAITTPLMLLTLCVVLGRNTNRSLKLSTYAIIIALNYLMLIIGYAGETNIISRFMGMITGFGAFFAMFYYIYINFVQTRPIIANNVLFGLYASVWGLYGIVYMFNEEYKNIFMNMLDCTAKCLVGLGLWAYYTKIIV